MQLIAKHFYRYRMIFLLACMVPLGTAPVEAGSDQSIGTITSPALGCVDKESLTQVEHLAHEDDKNALSAMTLSGRCVMLHAGEKAYLEESHGFSGYIEIRREGETRNLWTIIEAFHQDAN